MPSRYFSLIICLAFAQSSFASQQLVKEKSPPAEFSSQVTVPDILKLIAQVGEYDEQTMDLAGELLSSAYETDKKAFETKVEGAHYGHTFSIHPEVMAYLMRFSRGKRVLELGAARGENALLLGFAGAQEVVINDINEQELAVCKSNLAKLPELIRKKFQIIKGDCLHIFDGEEFADSFDVIYLRNLYHFFAGEQREKCISLVNRLLKAGGKLIITANSALVGLRRTALQTVPDAYTFIHV